MAEAVKRIGRSTVSGCDCSRKVHLTKCLKCGRMNRLTVLDRLLKKKGKRIWSELQFIKCLLDKIDRM